MFKQHLLLQFYNCSNKDFYLFNKEDNIVLNEISKKIEQHKFSLFFSHAIFFNLNILSAFIVNIGFICMIVGGLITFFEGDYFLLLNNFDFLWDNIYWLLVLLFSPLILLYIQNYIYSEKINTKYGKIIIPTSYFEYFHDRIKNLETLPLYQEIEQNKDNLYGLWLLFITLKHINYHDEKRLYNYGHFSFYSNIKNSVE